jgi:hypothetical protein
MKPMFSVTANVNINSRDDLHLLTSCKIKRTKVRSHIVPSHIFCIAAFCLLLSASARGTSVAIMVTDTMILIGTDGIDTRIINGVQTHGGFCKIRNEGSIFYTASGSYMNSEIGFDLWRLAKNVIQDSRSMLKIYPLIEPKILAQLPAIVERGRRTDRENYARWLTGIPVIAISFASFERNVPTVATIYFQIDSAGTIVKPTKRTLYGVPGQVQSALLGYNAEMKAAIALPIWGSIFTKNPVSFVEALIQSEIDASKRENRNDVGPPITILRITGIGGEFEPNHKGNCP